MLFTTFGEPSIDFPAPPTPKALNTNFYQIKLEPSLPTPNHALRVRRNVVLDIFKESLTSHTQISKGYEEKRASKVKKDLVAWLILFQPFHEERRGGNHLN